MTSPTVIEIAVERPDQPDVEALLAEGLAYLQARFSEDECFTLDLEGLRRPEVTFLVARVGSVPVACGAIVEEDGFIEIKRMFVSERARGTGIGRLMLQRLLDAARARGAERVVLETGVGLDAAIRLYRSAGFVDIPAFGAYTASAASICMELRLG